MLRQTTSSVPIFANGAISAAFSRMFNDLKISAIAKFKKILTVGKINLQANALAAKKMGFWDWIDKVRGGGDWDYKFSLDGKGLGDNLLNQFGNFHFGITAAARGYSLSFTLWGAGTSEAWLQDGNHRIAWGFASPIAPEWMARSLTIGGFSWGDNHGASRSIMRGWEYYQNNM